MSYEVTINCDFVKKIADEAVREFAERLATIFPDKRYELLKIANNVQHSGLDCVGRWANNDWASDRDCYVSESMMQTPAIVSNEEKEMHSYVVSGLSPDEYKAKVAVLRRQGMTQAEREYEDLCLSAMEDELKEMNEDFERRWKELDIRLHKD